MKNKVVAIILAFVMILMLASCQNGEYAMKYEKTTMSKSEYSYWFSTLKTQMLASYNSGIDSDEFWNTETEDGLTYEEILTDSIKTQISSILISVSLFDKYGLELDDETINAIDADIADKEDYIGSRSEMNAELAKLGLNIDVLRDVYINSAKVSAVREYLYGEDGINAPSDSDIEAYFAENYRAIKMIIVYTGIEITTDDDGNYVYDEEGNVETVALDDEQKAIKAELVDTIIAALESGADIDECVAEFSEVDYSEYPNGFFISKTDSASYGSDVVDAAWNMEIGEVRSVADDVMTFILYRDELPEYANLDSTEQTPVSDMETNMVNELINEMYAPLIKETEENEEIISEFDIREAHMNSYY